MTVDHLASASLYVHMNANARGTTHITTCAHELHSTPPSAFPALLSRETQRRSQPACVERTTAGERRGHRAAGPYSHLFIQPSQRTRAERVRQVPGPALPRERTRKRGAWECALAHGPGLLDADARSGATPHAASLA